MQTVSRSNFTTVKTEGAILPANLLQRIADGDLDGLQPEAYHLAPNERPNEAINRAWNRCLGVWQSFNKQRQNLPATDTGTSLTRERWLLILFQELGYGRLPFQRRIELPDGSVYPISHLWGQTPIHLVSFRQALDNRDPTIKRSPHSLMQEFLNRTDEYLWGFVSNGLTLRVLRDNVSLTRAAYLEFDLEAMMTGELYADFSLLWLVCHQSRVEIGPQPDAPTLPSNCWLETWSQAAAEQGTRALDALRDGVQEAIAALGRGFLAHPANTELRHQLNSGELSTQTYYRQLLRLVYRLIFLFVAEDRDLLLVRDTPPNPPEGETDSPPFGPGGPHERYRQYYSISRLRRLAEGRRGGPYPDLYRALRRVFFLLRRGYEPLSLPALGSFLFSDRSTPALDGADIANSDLLNAIRALAFTIEGRVRRPVDYKNLGSEELGSVYESLLELHPQLNIAAASFELATAAGSERKTTGSYYTPSSLINSLLDSALEPVIEDRLRQAEEQRGGGAGGSEKSPLPPGSPAPRPEKVSLEEEAILNIKVVDPACGSGHFLIAAGNRLAAHLARIRTGDDEPAPGARREALRDVVRHCIHGVDINEMSVELCKVALWMETLDPGKPLGFLDANIRCGNSLIGATPTLLKKGIPDDAFKPITGDDKAYCSEWKARNKKERGQMVMELDAQPWERLGDLAAAMVDLDQMDDKTLAGVQAQESKYADLVRSTPYLYSQFWADAWCAAFVWPKKPEYDGGYAYPITEAGFRKIERNPHDVALWMREEIERLREEYQFFHWHLAFPHVFSVPSPDEGADNEQTGWNGGFDVVLGNPPWERIKLEEKEWFAARDSDIANAANAAARSKKITALVKENSALYTAFKNDKRVAEGKSHFMRNTDRYPLCGRGDINTYTIFAELSRHIQSNFGSVGIIVPSGIATDSTTQYFFQDIVERQSLVSLYSFENEELIFPAVHHATKFCLLTLTGRSRPSSVADFVFFARQVSYLGDEFRHFSLSADEIKLLNPNTRTCPIFRSKRDAELVKRICRNVPVLISDQKPAGNPWDVRLAAMFHMSNDSGFFRTQEQLDSDGWILEGNYFEKDDAVYMPLYEGKMLHHFDHRFGTYEGQTQAQANQGKLPELTPLQHLDPSLYSLPRYWVPSRKVEEWLINNEYDQGWFIAFRDITSAVVLRTSIFSVIPQVGVGNNAPLALIGSKFRSQSVFFPSIVSSYVFDFAARLSLGGSHMNFYILKQLPVLPPSTFSQQCNWNKQPSTSIADWLIPRILELTYTAWDLQPFAQDCGYHGPPFRWDEERRFLLRCELDAVYFHLYGIERGDVDYIMETFPIVKRRDEAAHGEYRTKRVIMEIYDELAAAMRTDRPYQTRLDPPPADPRLAHPWDPAFGPEPDQLWVEIDRSVDDERRTTHSTSSGQADETAPTIAEPPTPYSPRSVPTPEPRTPKPEPQTPEPLILRQPEPEIKKPKKPKPARAAQGTFMEVMPAPAGPYNVRLKRVMALGGDPSPLATRELVAFLADENSNIRWLAGSSLVQRSGGEAGADTVAAIATFLTQAEPERVEQANSEALRVLGLIADTAEEESVRAAAGDALDKFRG